MSSLVIFTVYGLCPVKRNSWTGWFFLIFEESWNSSLIFVMFCSFISAKWEWAEVELRGTWNSLCYEKMGVIGWSFTYCCCWACSHSLQCFALLHGLLNNTGAGTERGGGVLISGIPLLIVMQSLSTDTQCQHMSCQQMIFQLLLKKIYEIKFKCDCMLQLNSVSACFLYMRNSISPFLFFSVIFCLSFPAVCVCYGVAFLLAWWHLCSKPSISIQLAKDLYPWDHVLGKHAFLYHLGRVPSPASFYT